MFVEDPPQEEPGPQMGAPLQNATMQGMTPLLTKCYNARTDPITDPITGVCRAAAGRGQTCLVHHPGWKRLACPPVAGLSARGVRPPAAEGFDERGYVIINYRTDPFINYRTDPFTDPFI